ncbi:unnamed protein product [Durusdinium trenchii]|uniref:AP2/ERF domain-containing protein n=1 Tax=Durusdinium trenchii TaxID=1381693 RepID=A0ABP0KBD6_9DINO
MAHAVEAVDATAQAPKRRRLRRLYQEEEDATMAVDEVKEANPRSTGEADGADSSRETEQKPKRPHRPYLEKRSGIQNITWNRVCWAWEVGFPIFEQRGKKKNGYTTRQFALKKYMKDGHTESEADAAALEAAKAFRAEQVQKGVLKESKPMDSNFLNKVLGVTWWKAAGKWRVQVTVPTSRKRISGGFFTDKAAAEKKALEIAEAHGVKRTVTAVGSLADLAVIQPKVPYPNVTWSQLGQCWVAQCDVGGSRQIFRVKPESLSEAELEASHAKAVAWKKEREKQKEEEKQEKERKKTEQGRQKDGQCKSKKSKKSKDTFQDSLQNLQTFLEKNGVLPWHKSPDKSERLLGCFVQKLRTMQKEGTLSAEGLQQVNSCCPLWKEHGEAHRVVPVVRMDDMDQPDGQDSHSTRRHFLAARAALQVAACKSSDERRALLQTMRKKFHPDKNVGNEDEVRLTFDFIQSMWKKEFGGNRRA